MTEPWDQDKHHSKDTVRYKHRLTGMILVESLVEGITHPLHKVIKADPKKER